MSNNLLMLVDDEAAIRESLAEFLSMSGFELCEAGSEDEAFVLAQKVHPSVVLSDMNLGNGGTGLSLFSRLKKDMAGAEEPSCILMTGFGSVENAIEAIRLGVDDYLLKPVNLDELKSAVNGGLARKSFRETSLSDPGAALADRFYHEVSSPLTVLRACLDMFADGRFGPLTMVQENKMEMVQKKMRQVLTVLRGFHSRIENAPSIAPLETLDPEALFREVQQLFFLDFERRGVNVVVSLPGRLPAVRVDRRQAVMLLEALIGYCLTVARFGMTLRIRWVQQSDSLGLQFHLLPWEMAANEKPFPLFSNPTMEAAGLALHTDLSSGLATLLFQQIARAPI